MDSSLLIKLIFGGLILFGFWYALRSKWTFAVVADADGIRSCSGLSRARQESLATFLKKNVGLKNKVTIRGRREADGRLRLSFRGRIDQGSRQQIRNFLLEYL